MRKFMLHFKGAIQASVRRISGQGKLKTKNRETSE